LRKQIRQQCRVSKGTDAVRQHGGIFMTRERALMLIVGVLAVSLVAVILGQNRTFVSAAQAAPPPACTDALLNGRCRFTEEGYLTNATAFSQAVAAFAPAAGIGYLVADSHGNLTGTGITSVGGELVSRTSTGTYSAVIDPNDRTFRSLQVSPTGAVFTALGSKGSRVWLSGGHHG
jgi:hypothetical protein